MAGGCELQPDDSVQTGIGPEALYWLDKTVECLDSNANADDVDPDEVGPLSARALMTWRAAHRFSHLLAQGESPILIPPESLAIYDLTDYADRRGYTLPKAS